MVTRTRARIDFPIGSNLAIVGLNCLTRTSTSVAHFAPALRAYSGAGRAHFKIGFSDKSDNQPNLIT